MAGCGGGKAETKEDKKPTQGAASQPASAPTMQQQADTFLKAYFDDYSALEKTAALAYWTAANSGKKEDFDAYAQADLALKMLHADTARYEQVKQLAAGKAELTPMTARSLEVAELAFKGNQLPKETLEKLSAASAEIEQVFKSYRADLGGKKLTNNDLLDILSKEKDSTKRQQAWEASKQVGAQVDKKLVELAKIRNEAAKTLGYADYWDMQIRLQEHDPAMIVAIFDELQKLTDAPFAAMKKTMDAEVAKRFKLKPDKLMPWHYTNPFFQAAPPSEAVDLDEFYKAKPKEEIVELAKKFYADIDLDITPIMARSDFYEREGKDQHAFCITMDRLDDVRTLLNVKPTADWMETMLHEMGHAVYYTGIDKEMPFNLREAAHIFTTEATAMLFGALAANPVWLTAYAGADEKRVKAVEAGILEQRRREQLIFVRWGLVMLNYEKALYANPDQDLNKLWYDMVEKYQSLNRPPKRAAPDWAAKPHFTSSPVYYHNYVLGELFAAQLRATMAKMVNHVGPTSSMSFNGRKEFGQLMKDKVFKPGMSKPWPDFVQEATGEPLAPAAFAAEVSAAAK
jgi:peptidyl-dipeptidase A